MKKTRRDPTATDLADSHTPRAIRDRLNQRPSHSYLRDFIYGAIDGTVTTFAVVSGVAGAGLSSGIVIVLGVANLLGDGFSMGVSNFLGTKAEDQQRQLARRLEEHHISVLPEGEREEVRQIFAAKGLSGSHLETVVDTITSDVNRWVETMMREELGLALHGPSAWRAAASTFVAFVLLGSIPLLSFVLKVSWPGLIEDPFPISALLTGISFFGIGAVKCLFVDESWYRAGLETLLIGGIAALLAYLAGAILKGLVPFV